MKRRKKSDRTKAKEKAWKLCSEYNRRKYASENGNVKCFSCSTVKHWKEMQAGHFIPGRGESVLFEDTGIHAQCFACNINKKGNWADYYMAMEEFYGKNEINRLIDLKNKTCLRNECDYVELQNKYKQLLKNMEAI